MGLSVDVDIDNTMSIQEMRKQLLLASMQAITKTLIKHLESGDEVSLREDKVGNTNSYILTIALK